MEGQTKLMLTSLWRFQNFSNQHVWWSGTKWWIVGIVSAVMRDSYKLIYTDRLCATSSISSSSVQSVSKKTFLSNYINGLCVYFTSQAFMKRPYKEVKQQTLTSMLLQCSVILWPGSKLNK